MNDMAVGIDTGGTFTDFIAVTGGDVTVRKVPSTPDDPARAVLDGIRGLPGAGEARRIVHGSTVATNALLERKGARTALITTKGFEDVIEIGRQTRPRIYDIMVERFSPLVDRSDRFGLAERTGPFGEVEKDVSVEEVTAIAAELREKGIESVAICLLNSYANPRNERVVEEKLREYGGWPLSVSCRIVPEYREYERCSTTVINAYVKVLMAGYIALLSRELSADVFRVMQSNGGFISPARAVEETVRTILSGPAGGVTGALEVGRQAGLSDIISFDMGGTSTDVCLCRGEVATTTEMETGGCPVRVPVIDVHTVGAGGGSIAWIDGGGALRVGPESAGADPGPICYGVGHDLTVTDAHLFLGRLDERWFLDGTMSLDVDRVSSAMDDLAGKVGKSPSGAALGIIEVANVTMERAIRVISLEKGHDPGDFTLVAFGGAGALHACDIARDLSIGRVLIPADAGALSAKGMLTADIVIDHSASVLAEWEGWSGESATALFRGLEADTSCEMKDEAGEGGEWTIERTIDMRYVGQSYELNVPWSEHADEEFHCMHQRRYGFAEQGRGVEVVTARVRAVSRVPCPPVPRERESADIARDARTGRREVYFRDGPRQTDVYLRGRLRPGNRIEGPAIVVEYTATSLIPPGVEAKVDRYGSLILELR